MKRIVRSGIVAVLVLGIIGWWTAGAAAEEFEKYGLDSVSTALSTTQAGAHADFTLTFQLTSRETGEEAGQPYALTRDIESRLPPGIIGNPQAVPSCSVAELGESPSESECPLASQVGVTVVRVVQPVPLEFIEPVYNMEAPQGDIVARLGFYAGGYPAFINVRINPTDYSLIATIEGGPASAQLLGASTTLWGVPAAHSHDTERMTPLEADGQHSPPPREVDLPERPFMTNPTDCSTSRTVTVTARSYQLPDQSSTMSAPFPDITGCGQLSFEPEFTAVPTNPEASAPTGLDTDLIMPQDETPQGRATSTLKSATVMLPPGLTINPSAGDGLGSCSSEQVGFGSNESSHCPSGAKIGSAEIEVPLLAQTLHGSVYQRTPEPGRLFRFWLVTDEQGVHLKLPAEIQANPLTGQLTAIFSGIASLGGLPQVPVRELRLHIFGGPRAPLATPSSCGIYQTQYAFSPWSGKPQAEGTTPMRITSGCAKGGFAPKLSGGTTSLRAGSFSPFVFTLVRQDGEGEPRTLGVHLPQGLLAKLGGVPLCPESAAGTGACPIDSRIGRLTVAAGVGGVPLWLPQPDKPATAIYLAGPYNGAPFSIISVVPAQAGPFDLGTVVDRAAIEVDPETAQATIRTDPLPQILKGVPVFYRTIHVLVDRPNFTLNPTSCAKKRIAATVAAVNGSMSEPSDVFQATNCAKLAYKPKLKLSFGGQTNRTGNPAITAVLTQKPHQSNTKSAVVLMPQGEFIDNEHIPTPCTRVQFAAHDCPKSTVIGFAIAKTSLLDRPLKGPVYFRSNGGDRALPDLVADLRGPIRISLVGYIDAVKTGSESSRVRVRFLHVPDAPVTRFAMSFFGGKKGLIENSVDLCRRRPRMDLRLRAQNGRSRNLQLVPQTKCRVK